MSGLTSGVQPYHVTLTTPDGIDINLISVSQNGEPHEFDGTLEPADPTTQFRPGGIAREFNDFSAGGGYTFFDERAPNSFAWSKNVWTLVPHAAVPSGALTEISLPATNDGGTHGEIRTGIESNGNLYVSTGKYCVKVAGYTGAASQVANFASTAGLAPYVATSSCLYRGNAYWGGFDSTGATTTAAALIQQILPTDSFAASTATRWHVASFFGVDGNGSWAQWLIGTVFDNTGYRYTNSAAPMTDSNWSPSSGTGITISNYPDQCNKIVASRQAPFFLMQNGVRIVQRLGQYIPNVTPHWGDTYWSLNGNAGAIVAGRLYASISGGIDMVVGLEGQLNDTPQLVQPGADLPNESPVAGECYAITRDGDWIVAAIYNSANTTSYICWGKPRSTIPGQPGLTNFVWHASPCVIEGEKVTWMKKVSPVQGTDGGGTPYLMIATRNAAGTASHLYYLSLPKNGNVLQELANGGPWRCRTDTCVLYLPSNPWSQGVHSQKAVRQVATVSKSASDTSYLRVYVSADEAARVQLGGDVTESPYVESVITSDINGRQLAPQVEFKAGSSTTPPILRAVTLWAGEGVRASTVYQGRFRFGQGVQLRNRSQDTTTDPQATFELLKGSQGPRPATITDWKGTSYTVAMEQGAVWKEREVRDGSRWEIDAAIKFTILAKDAVWQDGSVWDSEVSWA